MASRQQKDAKSNIAMAMDSSESGEKMMPVVIVVIYGLVVVLNDVRVKLTCAST